MKLNLFIIIFLFIFIQITLIIHFVDIRKNQEKIITQNEQLISTIHILKDIPDLSIIKKPKPKLEKESFYINQLERYNYVQNTTIQY